MQIRNPLTEPLSPICIDVFCHHLFCIYIILIHVFLVFLLFEFVGQRFVGLAITLRPARGEKIDPHKPSLC